MQRKRFEFLFHTAMLLALLIWPQVPFAMQVSGSNLPEGQWINADTPLRIQLDQAPTADEIRVFVGSTDLTGLFWISKNELIFQQGIVGFPSGEGELKVFEVRDNNWKEVGSIPIRVRKISGIDRIDVQPQVNLTVKAQFDEGHSEDAGTPQRRTFDDLTGQGGIGLNIARGNFSIQAQNNFIGSSFRQEALQFGEKGESAPKVDLSDYLLTFNKGNANISVGNGSYQGSRYVLSSASNRGVTAGYQFGERVSLAATAQNATGIVGFQNLAGLKQSDNRTYGFKMGVELLERPGAFRIGLFGLHGRQLSNPGFNVGEITDAEESRSAAVRLSASTPESLLSGEIEFARSRYTNPGDPFLDQGFDVVEVDHTTDNARYGRILINAYQGQLESGKPLSLSFTYEHEEVDPLFKTVGAFSQADNTRNQFALNAMISDVSLNASTEESHDNLDDIATLLTTKTRNFQANLSIPIKTMLLPEASYDPNRTEPSETTKNIFSYGIPNLSASYMRIHQFADNRPDLDPLSGFSASHLPDQLTTTIALSANWDGPTWNLTANHNRSKQDNRQTGREKADFLNTTRGISGQIQIFNPLSLTAGTTRTKVNDEEQAITSITKSHNIGLNLILFEAWTINGSFETSRTTDSENNATSESHSGNAQLTWQYTVPGIGGARLPGQAYLRYDRQISKSVDNVFDFQSNVSNWTFLGGLSFSLF